MWGLCGPAPSIRLIDFSEAFHSPFEPDRQSLPGTPRDFAAPDLLLGFASELTIAIDIWALGCVIFQLFGASNPFVEVSGPLSYYIADMIKVLGMNAVPERVRDAICKMVAGRIMEDGTDLCEPMWDEPFNYLRGDPEDDPELLPKEDEEILKKVLYATLVIDPTGRKPAATILGMIQNGWEAGITA
jgi:serine/threonine protein kinase